MFDVSEHLREFHLKNRLSKTYTIHNQLTNGSHIFFPVVVVLCFLYFFLFGVSSFFIYIFFFKSVSCCLNRSYIFHGSMERNTQHEHTCTFTMRIHLQSTMWSVSMSQSERAQNGKTSGSNSRNLLHTVYSPNEETHETERQSTVMGRREIANKIWNIDCQQKKHHSICKQH